MKLILFLSLIILILILILIGIIRFFTKEDKKQKEEIQAAKNRNIYLEKIILENQEKMKEYEELKKKAYSGNSTDNFDASIELLHKQTESGKQRNQ